MDAGGAPRRLAGAGAPAAAAAGGEAAPGRLPAQGAPQPVFVLRWETPRRQPPSPASSVNPPFAHAADVICPGSTQLHASAIDPPLHRRDYCS